MKLSNFYEGQLVRVKKSIRVQELLARHGCTCIPGQIYTIEEIDPLADKDSLQILLTGANWVKSSCISPLLKPLIKVRDL